MPGLMTRDTCSDILLRSKLSEILFWIHHTTHGNTPQAIAHFSTLSHHLQVTM